MDADFQNVKKCGVYWLQEQLKIFLDIVKKLMIYYNKWGYA
jgi:hypothetical protein